MNFNISKFKYTPVNDLVPICNHIPEVAKKKKAQLMNYNITAAMIDAFALLTESPDQSAPSHRNAPAKEDRPAKP